MSLQTDTYLPLFPLDLIQRHRNIAIIAGRSQGKSCLARHLASCSEFNGSTRVKSTRTLNLDGSDPVECEARLREQLAKPELSESLTTVILDNFTRWQTVTLGNTLMNNNYFGLNMVLLSQSIRGVDAAWFTFVDYVFVRWPSARDKEELWSMCDLGARGISLEQFSVAAERYSAGNGWLVINRRRDRQFSEPLYWTHYENYDEQPEELIVRAGPATAEPTEGIAPAPAACATEPESYGSMLWRWVTWQ